MDSRDSRAAFRHRDFRLQTAGSFLGTTALQMQTVAIGAQVYDQTGKALDLGLVGLMQFLPAVLLALLAGEVADRVDRRRVVVAGQSVLCVCAAVFYGLARVKAEFWTLEATILVLGVARAFSRPASSALTPQLVPKEDFANAVSWSSSAWQAALIAGPALGGLIYWLAAGAAPVYLVACLLFVSSTLAYAAIEPRGVPPRSDGKEPALQRFLAGVRYVAHHRLVLGAISLDMFAVLFGGVTALLPIYAKDILQVDKWGLGLMRAAPSAGATVMAAWIAHRPIGGKAGRKLFLAVALFGAATVVFAFSRVFVLSVIMLVVLGAADVISVVTRQTMIQLATPDEKRGRVSAINTVFIGASNELGEFESGVTADWFGTVWAAGLGGICTLLVVASWWFLFPELSQVDRLEDLAPASGTG